MPFKFLKTLDADDIFISYSRCDGEAYLTGLDAALSKLGFSCFSDKRGTEANPTPPQTLFRKARTCKTLVLLGTSGALAKPEHIAPEVNAFAEANGTARIIGVSFDRDEELQDWSKTPWYTQVVGKSREREYRKALTTGEPSPSIVTNIANLSNYMKSKDRLRKYRNRTLFVLGVLVMASIGATVLAFLMSSRANEARTRADREQAIAGARSLANRSQTLLRQKPEALQRSIALAIAAVAMSAQHDSHTVESDSALRESLSLLATQVERKIYSGQITATALSPDANHFATLSADNILRTYKVGETAPAGEFKGFTAHDIAISNDAAVAAMALHDEVKIFDLKNCDVRAGNPCTHRRLIKLSEVPLVNSLNEEEEDTDVSEEDDEYIEIVVERIALSPNGRYLGIIKSIQDTGTQSGVADIENSINEASVYDLKTGREIKTLSKDQRHHSITFSSEGDLAVAAGLRLRSEYTGFSGMVFLWRLSGKLQGDETANSLVQEDFVLETFPQKQEVFSVALASKFGLMATNRAIWRRNEVGTFTASAYFPVNEGAPTYISDVAFRADGKQLIAVRRMPSATVSSLNIVAAERAVEVWKTAEQPDSAHAFLPRHIVSVGFLPGDQSIAVGLQYDDSGNPRLFDATTAAESKSDDPTGVEASSDKPERKFISDNGRFVISAGGRNVYVGDALQTNKVTVALPAELTSARDITAAISDDGRFLALANASFGPNTTTAAIYESMGASYHLRHHLTLNGIATGDLFGAKLAITSNGTRLVTSHSDMVHVWDVPAGREVTPKSISDLSTPTSINEVTSVELSGAGNYLAVAYSKQALPTSNGNVERDPEDDDDEARAEKPDNVMVVRLRDGVIVNHIEHPTRISSMVFSARESYLLTASTQGLTVLSNLNSSKPVHVMRSDSAVESAAFSADERYLALGSSEGTRVLLTSDPQTETTLLPDTGTVVAIAFSGDGRLLATGSRRESTSYQDSNEDNPLRIWQLRPDELIAEANRRLASIPPDLRVTVEAK